MRHELLLIDAPIWFFRYFFAVPPGRTAPNGELVHGTHGFAGFLLDLIESHPGIPMALAFDASLVSCFRNAIYPEYKANREEADDNIRFQLLGCMAVGSALGLWTHEDPDYEADDIIASLRRIVGDAQPATIVTRDKDLGQVLRPVDRLLDPAGGRDLSAEELADDVGVPLSALADLLAIAGDSVDNIPGIPGIGPKTAIALLREHGSLDGIYAHLDGGGEFAVRGAKRAAGLFRDHRDAVYLYRSITGLVDDMALEFDAAASRPHAQPDLPDVFAAHGLDGLVERARRISR